MPDTGILNRVVAPLSRKKIDYLQGVSHSSALKDTQHQSFIHKRIKILLLSQRKEVKEWQKKEKYTLQF